MLSIFGKTAGKGLLWLFSLLFLLALTACSESSGDSSGAIPLSSPKIVQATANDGAIVLQWTKVGDAQGVEASYKVFMNTVDDPLTATDTGVTPTITGQHVGATISGLTNDTKYYFWVKAVFGSLGEAGFSPVTSGIPVPPAEAIAVIYPTAGDNITWLQWDESPHAFSYNIFYSKTDGSEPSDGSSVKTVYVPYTVLSGLNNSDTYYIWIRATNTAGASTYTKTSVTPVENTTAVPAAPLITGIETGNKRLTVTWTTEPTASYYKVFYKKESESTWGSTASINPEVGSVSGKITGLENGVRYNIKVVAYNHKGDSPDSIERTGTPTAPASGGLDLENTATELGTAAGVYIFAEDLPKSPHWPNGRANTDRLTRVKETALGNLFTDATAWYVREKLNEPIDFVFLNGGYIDNAITSGPITVGTVLSAVSSDSREDALVILTLKGSEVKALFDFAATVSHTGRGSSGTGAFGIVSKEVNYTIEYPIFTVAEMTPPISSTSRTDYLYGTIKADTLKLNGADIVDDVNYRIATTSYLFIGRDGYLVFPKNAVNVKETTTPFWHGVAEYIYDQKTITPYLDGRITIYGGVPLGGTPQAPYNAAPYPALVYP